MMVLDRMRDSGVATEIYLYFAMGETVSPELLRKWLWWEAKWWDEEHIPRTEHPVRFYWHKFIHPRRGFRTFIQ